MQSVQTRQGVVFGQRLVAFYPLKYFWCAASRVFSATVASIYLYMYIYMYRYVYL